MLSSLVCFGRHTVTSMLSAAGCQFRDWSADYRLFSKSRFRAAPLFDVALRGVVAELEEGEPLVVAIDDTLLRKTGSRTPGVVYRRDPLGPKFQPNFVLAQRVLQVSAALPLDGPAGLVRMVPIDFRHAPTPKKPKKDASEQDRKAYRAQQKVQSIAQLGLDRLVALRKTMDSKPSTAERMLWAVVDGSYTNRTVLGHLPDRTVLIGRIRGDAKLSFLPSKQKCIGRPRLYGAQAPTPRQLEQDDEVPWLEAKAYVAGDTRTLRYKRIDSLRWHVAGQRLLSLIVIAPIGYRGPGGKLCRRKPAFLICSDPNLTIERILQAYAWRWEIEVNFRDEKTLLGVGQAQVRHERSVEAVPAMGVAAYSLLLVASKSIGNASSGLPAPKWRDPSSYRRPSTQALINLLRAELWAGAFRQPTFSHFAVEHRSDTSPSKRTPLLESAALYACA